MVVGRGDARELIAGESFARYRLRACVLLMSLTAT